MYVIKSHGFLFPSSQFFQRFSCHPVYGPVLHGLRPHGKVKINTWLIPVQTPPLQPAAAPLQSDPRQFLQQRLSISVSPVFRFYIQILQIDSRLLKLAVVQCRIATVFLQQFFVAALLDDISMFHE